MNDFASPGLARGQEGEPGGGENQEPAGTATTSARRWAAWERVVRGFEYSKGKSLPVSSEELKALPLPTAHTVELLGFVNAEEIDALYFDKAYYLGPGKGGEKAYELLRRTLADRGKVGIGKVAIRTREHLVAVRPIGGPLGLQTPYSG